MPKEVYIELDNLIKKFGKKIVLDRVNLKIPLGSFYGILGLSGSGKTTLLNILVGFWKPTIGKITYDEKNLLKNRKRLKHKFGFATQAGAVYNDLTIKENLYYFGRLYNMKKEDIKKRSEILLDLVDLSGAEMVLAGELSTGMQRRLDIACALIHDPEILIMDEPTEDLDPVLRKELLALLKKINDEGTTIIITSHMLSDIENVCDKIAILHNGYIVEEGSPLVLKNKYSKNEEVHIITTPGQYEKLSKNLSNLDLSKMVVKKRKIILYVSNGEKILPEILEKVKKTKEKIVELKVTKPSMEEIFEVITKR